MPLENKLLQDLGCLQPDAQKHSRTIEAVSRLARKFAPFLKTTPGAVDAEWRVYAIDDGAFKSKLKNVATYGDVSAREKDACDVSMYWKTVLMSTSPTGARKYPNLAEFVWCALSLAHGNADTERSFSATARILTKERNSLHAGTVNGLMAVKSYLSSRKLHAHSMHVTSALVKSGLNSHAEHIKKEAASLDLAKAPLLKS